MTMKNPWVYLALGAVALYVLWGLHVDASITVPEDEIHTTYTPTQPHPAGAAATPGDLVQVNVLANTGVLADPFVLKGQTDPFGVGPLRGPDPDVLRGQPDPLSGPPPAYSPASYGH